MSVILQPQVHFPIVRQIANHLDTDTYYVRAVVRDADGITIATVDLKDKGEQRFQTKWRTPADGSGQGKYISIVTSVYTDSGYTTKSSNYGDEENTYLVFDRVMPAMRGGGGNLDSGTIRRIVQEELGKLPEPERFDYDRLPQMPDFTDRTGEVLASIGFLQEQLSKVPTKEPDLTGVQAALTECKDAIAALPAPTDYAPAMDRMISRIEGMEKGISRYQSDLKLFLSDIEAKLQAMVKKAVATAMKSTQFVSQIQFPTMMAPQQAPNEDEDGPKKIDLSKIAS